MVHMSGNTGTFRTYKNLYEFGESIFPSKSFIPGYKIVDYHNNSDFQTAS